MNEEKIFLESERLIFRKICRIDWVDLCLLLQDIAVMYAWEHAFTDEQVFAWLEENIKRYANEGFSYFAAIEKETGHFIGTIGPLREEIQGKEWIGIGYLLKRRYWHQGYALEGAKACLRYAFAHLKAEQVIAQIRPNNLSSRNVAEKLEMQIIGDYVKVYQGKKMPHLIYSKRNEIGHEEDKNGIISTSRE